MFKLCKLLLDVPGDSSQLLPPGASLLECAGAHFLLQVLQTLAKDTERHDAPVMTPSVMTSRISIKFESVVPYCI